MIDEDGDDHGRHDDGNDGGNCQLCRVGDDGPRSMWMS